MMSAKPQRLLGQEVRETFSKTQKQTISRPQKSENHQAFNGKKRMYPQQGFRAQSDYQRFAGR